MNPIGAAIFRIKQLLLSGGGPYFFFAACQSAATILAMTSLAAVRPIQQFDFIAKFFVTFQLSALLLDFGQNAIAQRKAVLHGRLAFDRVLTVKLWTVKVAILFVLFEGVSGDVNLSLAVLAGATQSFAVTARIAANAGVVKFPVMLSIMMPVIAVAAPVLSTKFSVIVALALAVLAPQLVQIIRPVIDLMRGNGLVLSWSNGPRLTTGGERLAVGLSAIGFAAAPQLLMATAEASGNAAFSRWAIAFACMGGATLVLTSYRVSAFHRIGQFYLGKKTWSLPRGELERLGVVVLLYFLASASVPIGFCWITGFPVEDVLVPMGVVAPAYLLTFLAGLMAIGSQVSGAWRIEGAVGAIRVPAVVLSGLLLSGDVTPLLAFAIILVVTEFLVVFARYMEAGI